ncbi:hypothetical protein RIB2604_02105260 [Aspergillus luchuensis]|uniref:Uncharacterized protein n=1 Tax=Aspergillus kawachii TaxID=1069201 RepID=A0A146FNZ9_ASPKA|nr:hypothetical protein RIB2604_02105260 [Aspergillus luchuensis]
MVAATKRSLSECLEGDELFVEAVRDEMITGNQAGVKLALQNTEIPVIYSKIDQLREKIEDFEAELAEFQQEVSEFQHASDQFGHIGFADIRDRSLSSFRRDVLNDTAVETQRVIDIGDVRAHGCHFKADAFLYEEDSRYLEVHPPRNGRGTFVLLYGVDSSLAKKIVKASEKRIGIDLFEERLNEFLDALDSAGYAALKQQQQQQQEEEEEEEEEEEYDSYTRYSRPLLN